MNLSGRLAAVELRNLVGWREPKQFLIHIERTGNVSEPMPINFSTHEVVGNLEECAIVEHDGESAGAELFEVSRYHGGGSPEEFSSLSRRCLPS